MTIPTSVYVYYAEWNAIPRRRRAAGRVCVFQAETSRADKTTRVAR